MQSQAAFSSGSDLATEAQEAALLSQVFSHPGLLASLAIAAKTAVIYLLVVLGLRLLGTRELGEMSAYDFVLIVVIANAVQNALVGGDNSLVGGLISAFTLLLTNRVLTFFLDTFPAFRKGLIGEPVVLVMDGRERERLMRREGIDREELMAALREHGVADLEDVKLAVLEVDGEISVVPKQGTTVHRMRRRFRGLRSS
jgi:uncharacterized membrane protein YcaP (DUF421 family)